MQLTEEQMKEVLQRAEDAFWAAIVEFAEENNLAGGDACPITAMNFETNAREAIQGWFTWAEPEETAKLRAYIQTYDDKYYDVDGAIAELDANNFQKEEDIEAYKHTTIVETSLTNGQYDQAKKQADGYGLVVVRDKDGKCRVAEPI